MKKFLMMLMAVASVFVMTGCADSPDEVVTKWGAAIIANDKVTSEECVTSGSKEINEFFLEGYKNGNEEYKAKFATDIAQVGEPEIDGDTAKVVIGDNKITFILKKVDGEWKIDFEATMEQ